MSHPTDNQGLPTLASDGRCCRWQSMVTPLLALITVVSIGTAAYFAGRDSRPTAALHNNLPLLDASAAISGEKYSIATGNVSEDADGLFVLDHNSGLLQCSVIYPRMGQFMARFSVNVNEAVGTGAKGGSYMMLTGRAQFPRASNRPAASTVVYVMDTASGNYACYGIPFDRVAMNANRQQQGLLVLIATGTANPVIDRDDLR
ncbi:MAG: hypothetical protein ACR2NZ_04320 [Rubripirellula sp.]